MDERLLTADERRLLQALLARAEDLDLPEGWLEEALVRVMDDGGMGSLLFLPHRTDRKFGRQAAELEFIDADGVPVSAAFNLDDAGAPFELDIFKADFSRLLRVPEQF